MKVLPRAVLLFVALEILLSGCATSTDAIVDTMQAAVKRGRGADDPKLDPNLRYLRVTIDGRVALLALGYLDPHPQGTTEVWYSAEREVVRLQNGRLVGTSGLTTEWRNVVLPELPVWSDLAALQEPFRWERTRDVMPGYRYGLRDLLLLSVIATPGTSALRGMELDKLIWFEERTVGEMPASVALPPARYAVAPGNDGAIVVYGEQCVAPQTCFTWQRWPAGN